MSKSMHLHGLWLLTVAGVVAAVVPASDAIGAEPRLGKYQVESRLAVTIPKDAMRVRIWMPLPQTDEVSEIAELKTLVQLGETAVPGAPAQPPQEAAAAQGTAPAKDADAASKAAQTDSTGGPPLSVNRDSRGNQVGYLELTRPRSGEVIVQQTFRLTRKETISSIDPAKTRALKAEEKKQHRNDLEPNAFIPLTPDIKKLAGEIVGAEKNPAVALRKIYDWMLANVDYWAKEPERYQPSPMGSAVYCLSTRSGDCADIHSLFIALARTAGIPARLVYGSMLKKPIAGSREDAGTHCWAEVFLPELGWQSADVALADIYQGTVEKTPKVEKLLAAATPTGEFGQDSKMVDYYFGNLDERRVVWSRGRDLMLEPAQAGVAVDSLPKAYVEIDGREHALWQRTTTYREGAE